MRVTGTFDTQAAIDVSLDKMLAIMHDKGAEEIFVKKLAPNDNSKNQPYFGYHLSELAFLPTGEVIPSESTSTKTTDPKRKIKYQTQIPLTWVDAHGEAFPAPNAKLIYYPQYPEVRFSGFLSGSKVKAGEWMDPKKQGRSEGRWLILGVSSTKEVFAYLVVPHSALSRELDNTEKLQITGVFSQLDLPEQTRKKSSREALIEKMAEIHHMGWIPSQKLNKDLSSSPYKALNGGGYTLEAMLGISPNGIAEPDYLGWEVKQFGVKDFPCKSPKPTTLMTPEPNGGLYVSDGSAAFVRKYGYPDKSGIPDRLNFSKKHITGKRHADTGLELTLVGYNQESGLIEKADGAIALLDVAGNIAASWSFAKLIEHWKTKHAQAVFVPCVRRKNATTGLPEYHYGKDIELGVGTGFEMLLDAMAAGYVYYDPGLKLENVSNPKSSPKRRSQFRVSHKRLDTLYHNFDFIQID